ncbi:MAG: TolC family protein [Flavisolibacter sp.]
MISTKPVLFLFIGLLLREPAKAQGQGGDSMITLRAAIDISQARYPLLLGRRAEMQAAAANIQVINYSNMPRLDAAYQANLSTANNITGLFYPGIVLPMSGPPSQSNDYTPVSGSAASLLFNWEALTFGAQDAQIKVAGAEAALKKVGLDRDIFQNSIEVIGKYLDVILAQENVGIQQQNIQRVEVNLKESRVLTKSGIRPGVDTALFLSELSKAKVGWLQASRQLQNEQWLLAQLLVMDRLPNPADTSLLTHLPVLTGRDSVFSSHPLVQYAQNQINLSRSKEQMLRTSWLPQLHVFGTLFARGSGVGVDGHLKIANGLGPSRFNYGAGFQLAFPILKYGEVKRQLQVQTLLTRSAQETLAQTNRELITQQRIAQTNFDNSLAVVQESELQLKAAAYAYSAMHTRYTTGLVNLSDMVQVQYNLLQAELSLRKAYWDTWQALLLEAAVKGDVTFFLNQIP